MKNKINDIIFESRCVLEELPCQSAAVEKAVKAITAAYRRKNKIIIFGNGGSAADAQHMAAEMVCRFEKERKALAALALTVNTSALTAIANDYDFKKIFSRQLEPLAKRGDVVIAISTSGNSPNVLEGVKQARKNGAYIIGWTGASGGRLKRAADLCISVPSDVTARIQEGHLLILHAICKLVEESVFRRK